MSSTNPRPTALSDEQRRRVQSWLVPFDRDWAEGRLAEHVARLPPPPDPLRLPALLSLVRIDLERSWQSGRRPALESYLRLYPELGGADAVPFELVRAEYELRRRFDGVADPAPLAARFPRHAAELQRLAAQPGPARETAAPRGGRETLRAGSAASVPGEVPAAPRPLQGQFGRYRIEKKLGQGGMGAVYLAHDTELDRPVALKVPHFTAEDGPDACKRFRREAQAAATLDHPNLCPVFDVGEVGGVLYLTMAYIEGRPLADFLGGGRQLPQRQGALLVRKLAAALQEAHQKGVVHRDLKPSNVMINQRNEPVVMDFGLARRAVAGDVRLTKSGAIMGTPAYMAPEQVLGDSKAIGPACDVYALGVILYELLAGRLPFDGPVAAVLGQIMVVEPQPPRTHRPDLAPALEAICLRAMAKKVDDRYASMAELHEALGGYLRNAGTAVEKAAPSLPPTEPPRVPAQPVRLAPTLGDPGPADPPLIDLPPQAVQSVRRAPAPRRPLPWVAVGAILTVFGAAAAGIVLFVSAGNKGTVRIELDDPNGVVHIDGQKITIEKLGEPITLTPGDHQLVVKRGDVEVEARTFTLQRGEKQVLIIKLMERAAAQPDRGGEAAPGPGPIREPASEPPKEGAKPPPSPPVPVALDALVKKLTQGDGWGRYRAAEELRQRGDRAAAPALAQRVADDSHDPYPAKVAALEALRDLAADQVAPALARALASKTESVRVWACRELGREQNRESMTALVAAAKSDSARVRAAAALPLARQDEEEARAALRGLLKDMESRVRRAAVAALASVGGLYPVEALSEALADTDGPVRVDAALALQRLGERSAAEALRKRVADDSWLSGDPHAGKDHALNALRQLAPNDAVPALLDALKAKGEAVQVWACQRLAFEPNKEAGPVLLGALKSSSAKVRAAAAAALGMREEAAAKAELEKLSADTDYQVRQAVKLALGYLDKPAEVVAELQKLRGTSTNAYQAAEALRKLGNRSAVPSLIRRVADDAGDGYDYSGGRSAALSALTQLAPEFVGEALLLALRSKSESGRSWACGQLARKDRATTAALLACLSDPAPTVRSAALSAIHRQGESLPREVLLGLLADKDQTVRLNALNGLAAYSGAEGVEACCQALGDPDPTVRSHAASQLKQSNVLAAVPALMKCVADDHWSGSGFGGEKFAALDALKGLAPERAHEALDTALRSRTEQVRVWACSQFPAKDRQGSASLVAALGDNAVPVRKAAATALGQQQDSDSRAALVRALEDRAAEVRAAAATSLGQRNEGSASTGLKKLIADPDHAVRQAALTALTRDGGAEAVRLWIQALKDPQGTIRASAAQHLKQLNDKSAVPALSQRVADDLADNFDGGKYAALDALKHLDPEKATEALLQAMQSRDDGVQTWACSLLPPKEARSAAALTNALKKGAPTVRRAAAGALAGFNDADSAAALVASLRDGDAEVKRSAVFALGQRKEKSARDALQKLLDGEGETSSLRFSIQDALKRIDTSP